jgi:hypothetical protein
MDYKEFSSIFLEGK